MYWFINHGMNWCWPKYACMYVCASNGKKWKVQTNNEYSGLPEESLFQSVWKISSCTKPKHIYVSRAWYKIALAPGRFERNFRQVNFKLNLGIDGCEISYETVLRWMSMDLIDDKSTLVQVMAWPRSISPHCVTRLLYVNSIVNVLELPWFYIKL